MAERKINLEDLPSNSFSNSKKEEPEPITAVTTGNVKKGLKRRVASDIRNATAGLYEETLLPAFKGIISDFVSNALDMLLFGGQNGYRGSNRYGGNQRSYHNMYQQRQKPPQRGRLVSGSLALLWMRKYISCDVLTQRQSWLRCLSELQNMVG